MRSLIYWTRTELELIDQMFLIRRCILGKQSISQIPRSCGLSRRWISQTSILFNQNDDSIKDDTTSIGKTDPKKSSSKDLEKPEKIETSKATNKSKKLSVIEFMNQSRVKIPNDWRKDAGMPEWKRQKYALREKFKGKNWSPQKKLSREEMNSVKILKKELPDMTTAEIAVHFKISPEAVRRILRSKWEPTSEEEDNLFDRWKRRGEKIKGLYLEKEMNDATSKVFLKTGDKYTKVKFKKKKKSSTASANKDVQKKKKIRPKKPKLGDLVF